MPKGVYKRTKEQAKKIAETRKRLYKEGKLLNPMLGKHHSKETRKKISKTRLKRIKEGKIVPWNKGKKLPQVSGKNNFFFGKNFSGKNNPFYGKHHSEETKRKISATLKGKHIGKKHSEETKRKMSLSKLGEKNPNYRKYLSIATRLRRSKAQKGRKHSEETKLKIANSKKGKKRPKWIRKMLSEQMLNGGAIKALNGIKNPSKPQVQLFNFIKKTYPDAILNYPIQIRKDKGYSLDVAIPKLKIDYEFDGSYWHKGREVRDFFRDENLLENGWCVVRIKGIEELNSIIGGF